MEPPPPAVIEMCWRGGVVASGPRGACRFPRELLSVRAGGQTDSGQTDRMGINVNVGNDVVFGNGNHNGLGPGDSYCAAPGHSNEFANCKPFGDPPPRAYVFHVTRRRPKYVVGGVKVVSFQCLDICILSSNLQHKVRNVNEVSARDGASNVLLVHGSPPGRRRKDGVGRVLQDMASYWLISRWPVVVYVGNGGDLGRGVGRLFHDVGLPVAPCCSCSLWAPGAHRPGRVYHNMSGLAEIIPKCYNCHVPRDAVDQHWERYVSQWLIQHPNKIHKALLPHPSDHQQAPTSIHYQSISKISGHQNHQHPKNQKSIHPCIIDQLPMQPPGLGANVPNLGQSFLIDPNGLPMVEAARPQQA